MAGGSLEHQLLQDGPRFPGLRAGAIMGTVTAVDTIGVVTLRL